MSENKNTSSGGIGFCGLLAIVFITLKLCGIINWSWWWVTAPLWGGAVLILGIGAVIFLIALLLALLLTRKPTLARNRTELRKREESIARAFGGSHYEQ